MKELLEICVGVFCKPEKLIPSSDKSLEHFQKGCGEPVVELVLRLKTSIREQIGNLDLIFQRLDDLIALAKEKFYSFPFKDVPACWRDLFREASLLKFSALAVKNVWNLNIKKSSTYPALSEFQLDEMVRTIDMALIMAGPPPSEAMQTSIEKVLSLLQNFSLSSTEMQIENHRNKRRKIEDSSPIWEDQFPVSAAFLPSVTSPISRISMPSFDDFEKHMSHPVNADLGPEPLIITGALDHWPARNERPWNSPSYLVSTTIGGRRLVPIELGRSYVDEGWGQKIVTFKDFMKQYILDPESHGRSTGYLAQHNLFVQIPSLRQDIAIPDYCFTSPPPPHYSSPMAEQHSKAPQLNDPFLNAWFGPAGTISPLHTDPYHNILAQVVGRKYVRLYAPRESAKVYARGIEEGGVDMGNTSALDIGVLAGWDGTLEEQSTAHTTFPLFSEANFVDCILEEGECLYIPLGWWHYVRSLSVSFSVSFWFN